MDSYELNKIFGAILGTLLFVMGVGFLAEAIYAPVEDNGAGYALAEPESSGHGGEAAPVVEVVPLSVLLASADAGAGLKVLKKCASCHNFEEGSGNKTGPALYDIVGKAIASNEDFGYSDALVDLGGDWTYDALNDFLTSPKTFAPGTKMSFAGLRSEKDRANLLAYLQTLSAAPIAFPEVVEVAEEAGEDSHADDAHADEPTAQGEEAKAAH